MNTNLFDHQNVNLPILKQRAYNYRWAVQDADVIPLTAADSDFPVAQTITDSIQHYLASGYLPYSPAAGLPEFLECAAETMRQRKNIACTAENIFATNSAASALYLVAKYVLEPGQEALIANPVDFLMERSVVAAGGTVKRYGLDANNNFAFDPEEIVSLITPGKTKLLSICNPHNPLGRVWTADELRQLAQIAVQHDLWILSDEVWADIVYKPHQHTATASLSAEIAKRTFSVFGFSKGYGLAGLRLGLLICPTPAIRETMLQISHAEETAYGVSSLSQIAGMAAYETAVSWLDQFIQHLQSQRDYAVARLNEMDGVQCHLPEGTFVVFPDVSSFGKPVEEIVAHLSQHHGLAVVPGSPAFFGPAAAGYIRLSYATSRDILAQGLDRLEKGLETLS